MNIDEAQRRDKILAFLEQKNEWRTSYEIGEVVAKDEKIYTSLDLMNGEGVITERDNPNENGKRLYKISYKGKYLLSVGGYETQVNEEIMENSRAEEVRMSTINTNKFIKYTLWAIIAGVVLQFVYIMVSICESEKALQQHPHFQAQQELGGQPKQAKCPHDSL